jgi:tetratricopeptide (TPR) repeat protein
MAGRKTTLVSRMIAKRLIHTKLRLLLCLWLLSGGFISGAAASECKESVAHAVSIQGQVEVRSAGAVEWKAVHLDDEFCPGDRLRVSANSRAGLYLNNESFLRLGELSSVNFRASAEDGSTWLDLLQGIAHFISRIRHSFQVDTPYVNASIEGTEFTVQTEPSISRVIVMEGQVRVHNIQGESLLNSGQMAEAAEGQAPMIKAVVNPRDAVQWALYYPPVVDFSGEWIRAEDGTKSQKNLRRSLEAYRQGDLTGAYAALAEIESVQRDATLLIYRASLNLMVGRVDAARSDIEQALKLRPQDADALALMSIIATVRNDKREAVELAEHAVTANPRTASGHLALSYARQAQFRLAQALDAAKQAVKVEADNPLAWSRLAQLQLMFRNMRKASDAARHAVEIDPGVALSQTTLGFAYLIQLKLSSAKQAFERAVVLDQADPMPRLGLGLVLIREGELAEGRQLLETAANLDPGNALIRSYLGKAYYEEKRNEQAAAQFQLAKQLDRQDPTAWFYNAILKQTENRPLEALEDLQNAIVLNDNRAVYRSRLLLDEDQAARSASLARIYDDLGFQRLALKESWKSLAADPGNASAHRFLSDSYAGVPRHEIARVSELLRAQLLQPEIVSPVSPSASEASLLAFEGSGPSVAGFNEYNPLFNRQRLAFLASGVTGSNNTRGGEIAAGVFTNRGMLSVGHFTEKSDGFRENNDSDQTISNLFGQFHITSDLTIQGEVRHREGEFGDLLLHFNPDDNSTSLRRTIDRDSYRLGFNYSPDLRQSFLISIIAQELSDETTQSGVLLDTDSDGTQYEAQYNYQGDRFGIVAGAGYLDLDQTVTTSFIISVPIPGLPFPVMEAVTVTDDIKVKQKTAHLYLNLPWAMGQYMLGIDYVDIDDDKSISERQFNPKLGFIWNLSGATLVRLAAFRTLRHELIDNQTITPTEVAGFNQIYDDFLGTEADRYAMGIDHRFTNKLNGGLEISRRNITKVSDSRLSLPKEEQHELSHKAYLYWSVGRNIGLGSEYNYEKFERDFLDGMQEPDRPAELKTQSLEFSGNYFHASGFFGRITATHVKQEIENILSTSGASSADDRFWISDATLGYRLPKRIGKLELLVKNLFDKEFNYQSTHPGTGTPLPSSFYPERAFFLNVQLWL